MALYVNLSAKTEYACIAVLELALRHEQGEPVRIRNIADNHGIPSRFLVQILLQLKGAGLVTSTRGASGGYQLAKTPRKITLEDVMNVIEGRVADVQSNADDTPVTQALHAVWQQANDVERELLRSVTFADLAKNVGEQSDSMYYI